MGIHHCQHPRTSHNHRSPEKIDYIGQQDSATKISKTSNILSDILGQFSKEVHNEKAEFENLQEQRGRSLAQYKALKTDISTWEHKPLTLMFQQPPFPQFTDYNNNSGFQSHIRCQYKSYYNYQWTKFESGSHLSYKTLSTQTTSKDRNDIPFTWGSGQNDKHPTWWQHK